MQTTHMLYICLIFKYKQCAFSRTKEIPVNRTRTYQEAFRKYVLKYVFFTLGYMYACL